jgi:hypothetical protein
LAVVCTGVVAVVLAVGIPFSGQWYDLYVRHVAIREFEKTYGFRTGSVIVRQGDYSYEAWCIVSVAVDGEFAALGVREGDLLYNLGSHGKSSIILYVALVDASAGRASWFEVVNAADVGPTTMPRVIKVLPRRRQR